MTDNIIRIATRKSPLALWQAKYVQQQLMAAHPGLQVELVTLVTKGDVLLDSPLSKVGGKGLFVKELEQAMLDGYADLAVHSIKDIPVTFPQGLGLVTICPRENPLDAFVSNHYASVEDLPQRAVVGTSSLRRQCQLSAHRPDLQIRALRGNVGTRLSKLDAGDYDAIILASAGLIRLDLASRIRTHLPAEFSLPAVGQGAVGIECRLADQALIDLLAPLNHPDTETCVRAERAMNTRLEGGCQVPIASYAILENDQLWLRGLVGTPEGDVIITGERHGHRNQCQEMGISLADELLSRGARDILRTIYQDKTPL